MHIIIDTYGAHLEQEDGCFKISAEESERILSPVNVSSISITRGCTISSAAMLLAANSEIPIFVFNHHGADHLMVWSTAYGSIAAIRKNQWRFAGDAQAIVWAAGTIGWKADGQAHNLIYLANRRPASASLLKAEAAKITALKINMNENVPADRSGILAIEAMMSKCYWSAFVGLINEKAIFSGRGKRPASDRFNAAINYLYAILLSRTTMALIRAGLDPNCGFLHADQYNKPTLAFDCMEPFRPWVDLFLAEQWMNGVLHGEIVDVSVGMVSLNDMGKKTLLPAFYEFMEERCYFGGKRLRRNDHIQQWCIDLAQRLKKFEP